MKKKINTPIINGSVGIEIPIPMSIFSILMAMGVKSVIRSMILSREIKYKIAINKTTGNKPPHKWLLTTK